MADAPTITVTCPAGTLTGLARATTASFRGIRFATAERFSPPVDVMRWDGELDATSYGPQCPQVHGPLEQMLGAASLPSDEDCLHLNVETPACDGRRRPVLVWVHGGAYVTGGGAMPWYDGARLAAAGDVVVVTINYRLGALGFLGDRNSGTQDQIAALRWVDRNIEAFGGDPGDVTAFGESAGGSALLALLAAPAADDLFHRAVAMSPSILQLRDRDRARRFEAELLDLAGVATVEEFRALPIDDILRAQGAQLTRGSSAGLQYFAPTEGTADLPESILDAAAADPRPLVIGTTRDEMNLFTAFDPTRRTFDEERLRTEFRHRFGADADRAVECYRRHRPGLDLDRLTATMQTDEVFRWPAQSLAASRADRGRPTWMYVFDWPTPVFGGVLGACHGVDIPFAFDNLDRPGAEMFTGNGADRAEVGAQFSGAILAFARESDPGWPRYDLTTRATQRIGPDPELVKDPEPELRELWEHRVGR